MPLLYGGIYGILMLYRVFQWTAKSKPAPRRVQPAAVR
jgi:hypothetical protein